MVKIKSRIIEIYLLNFISCEPLREIQVKTIAYLSIFLFCVACSQNKDPYEAYRNGDYVSAKTQFTILAGQGDPSALTHLGVMYQLGLGVDKDIVKAIEFYQAATEKDYAPAKYNLALMYSEGVGVVKDEKKAFELFVQAARQGHSKAEFRMEQMLSSGVNQHQLRQLF